MNKKLIVVIGTIIMVFLGWFFYKKPQPPFGAVVTVVPINPQVEATYFAEMDANGTVLRVIVISQEMLNTGRWGDPVNWIQTWIENDPTKNPRKNYAGKGYKYEKDNDRFVLPKPFQSWILNENTGRWEAPKLIPINESIKYYWNEERLNWEIK